MSQEHTSTSFEHAVVIGAGFAGLIAARVLLDHARRVTLIERDRLSEQPVARKGVPQASHVHTLFPRGRLILEQLFPDFQREVVEAGVRVVDPCQDFAWLTPFGWGLRFASGLGMYMSSRELLEWCVRRRLMARAGIELRDDRDVVGLLTTGNGQRVGGVRLGSGVELAADLVVDASGRGSRAPAWLEELGFPVAEEHVVDASQGYASRIYRRPAGYGASWQILYVQQAPPDCTRGGIMTPIENGRILVTLAGTGGDVPPGDEHGFLEFAKSLRSRELHDTILSAEPLTPITKSRSTNNRRRWYEKLPRRLEGFLVLGDAMCAFNPVYGQGISSSALAGMALDACLRSGAHHLSRRFHAAVARSIGGPWTLATGEDYRVRGVKGEPRPAGLGFIHRYLDHAQALSTTSAPVRRALVEVFTMMKPLPSLFRPSVSTRVAWDAVRRGRPVVALPGEGLAAATLPLAQGTRVTPAVDHAG